jgi:predicted nucleotidyltransferase
MRSVALFMSLSVALTQAATRRVTVLVNFEKPHSDVSVKALQHELTELLEPVGVTVDLMLKSDIPKNPEFSELAVFEMKGSCSMDNVPARYPARYGDLPDERGPLAMSYSSDGQILHFGEVECDRVRQCLQRVTGRTEPEKHQVAYGKALGIVIVHELYHMIAGAKAHTKIGLTKESLSAEELLDSKLSLPRMVLEALRRGLTYRQ